MNMQKSILIITYDMIPHASSWGGCQRMYYFAEFLVAHGLEVTIFSCMKQTNDTFGNEIHFTNIPIPVKTRFLNNFINSKVRGQQENKSNTLKRYAKIRKYIKGKPFVLKSFGKIDRFLYNEPITLGGMISKQWVKENIYTIENYIDSHAIDTVIISVPAFGTLYAGKFIKRKYKDKVNLIYDYRDPWNLWGNASRYCFNKERRYLRYADNIICTTDNLCDDMSVKYKIDRGKFFVISNGYSEKKWSSVGMQETTAHKNFVISYVGQIEILYQGIRNIKNFLEAFRKFNKNDVLLRIVGVNDVGLDSVAKLRGEFSNIEILPPVDVGTSLKYMLDSDVLLLLHTTDDNSGRYIISGKFYDYARSGKAILSVDNGKGNHSKLIETYNMGISVRDDIDLILHALEKLYTEWKNNDLKKYCNSVEEFSREFQYQKYMELICE